MELDWSVQSSHIRTLFRPWQPGDGEDEATIQAAEERLGVGLPAFPQAIAILGDEQSQAVSQGRYLLPRLDSWVQFEQDYRRDNFSSTTQKELEELHRLARDYNTALDALRRPTNEVLVSQLTQARDILIQSDAYQVWFKLNSEDGNYRMAGPRQGNPAHQWFGLIAGMLSFGGGWSIGLALTLQIGLFGILLMDSLASCHCGDQRRKSCTQ